MKSIVNHNTIGATKRADGAQIISEPSAGVFAMSRFSKCCGSALLRNLKVGLGLASAIAGGLSAATATAQTPPSIDWSSGSEYDQGIETSVGYGFNQFMEVHSSQWEPSLWYHYGYIDSNGDVHTGPSVQYDSGQWPKIAMNAHGTAVEVHNDDGLGSMWYHVITCNSSTGVSDFGGSVFFDDGCMPCVAVNNNNVVVEEHLGGNDFYCRVGTLNAGTARIAWPSAQHVGDSGQSPAISVNDSGVVVEVHGAASGNLLYYRVGRVNGSKIVWGPSTQFDAGFYPSVALTNSGTVVEVHLAGYTWGSLWMGCDNLNLDDVNDLYESTGVVVGNKIVWSNPVLFDQGFQPSVATNGVYVLESHTSGSASYDANLWRSWGAFD